MSNIQDIRKLEQSIYDIVQDYVNECYNDEDVLAICGRYGQISLLADRRESIKAGKNTEIFSLSELVRQDDHGMPEPDNDKISEIANRWLFLN